MNDLEKLGLLLNILETASLGSVSSLGRLSSDMESLCSIISPPSESFTKGYGDLWAALEVIAVNHQEAGTEIFQNEVCGLREMIESFHREVKEEISRRNKSG